MRGVIIVFGMDGEERYSNRQIERLLDEQSRDIKAHIDLTTAPILNQVLKTNGRVTQNEKDITSYKIWRGWMTGGMAMLMIFLPIIMGLVTYVGLRIVQFDRQIPAIQTSIDGLNDKTDSP